jgi:hypothetical protein
MACNESAHLTLTDMWAALCNAYETVEQHPPGVDELLQILDAAGTLDVPGLKQQVDRWMAEYGKSAAELARTSRSPALITTWVDGDKQHCDMEEIHLEFWPLAAALLRATQSSDRRRLPALHHTADQLYWLSHQKFASPPKPATLLEGLVDDVLMVPPVLVEVFAAVGDRARAVWWDTIATDPVSGVASVAAVWRWSARYQWAFAFVDPDCVTGWRNPGCQPLDIAAQLVTEKVPDVRTAVASTHVAAFELWSDSEAAAMWLTELGLLPVAPTVAEMFASMLQCPLSVEQACTVIAASLR